MLARDFAPDISDVHITNSAHNGAGFNSSPREGGAREVTVEFVRESNT